MDVPSVVEEPHLYLLARSGSSDAEQAMYNEERFLDLLTLGQKVTTPDGIEIRDVLRFFHGDSPAVQFECGHNRAGHYICTSCTASVSKFDDIPTCYRSPVVDLKHRQSFILKGTTWKTAAAKPFEGLKVEQLRSEFRARKMIPDGKTKNELERELSQLRKGIQRFPALLQPFPEKKLQDIHLDQYEISPCEPLHDMKGHMANLFDEIPKHITGIVGAEVQKIKSAMLKVAGYRAVIVRSWRAPRARRSIAISRLSKSGYF